MSENEGLISISKYLYKSDLDNVRGNGISLIYENVTSSFRNITEHFKM
jgi:hypothetical protein